MRTCRRVPVVCRAAWLQWFGKLLPRLIDFAPEALAGVRSGAIVPGCAGMANFCARMEAELDVPVIDGLPQQSSLQAAEAGLVRRPPLTLRVVDLGPIS